MITKKIPAIITAVTNLSPTAKEITFTPSEPMAFLPGSFVNVFMNIDGTKVRRAFSLSSFRTETDTLRIAVRLSREGTMSPVFWNQNPIGLEVELMGPLGLHTADKMVHENIFLFGFGIGAGVVVSLAEYFSQKASVKNLVIVTGSRSDGDVLYQTYFAQLHRDNPKVRISHVVSKPQENSPFLHGYIQDHIAGYSFNDADIYICGQTVACEALRTTIEAQAPTDHLFHIEAFH